MINLCDLSLASFPPTKTTFPPTQLDKSIKLKPPLFQSSVSQFTFQLTTSYRFESLILNLQSLPVHKKIDGQKDRQNKCVLKNCCSKAIVQSCKQLHRPRFAYRQRL